MKDYIIFMDTSGDLDPDFASQHGVQYIPMEYMLDGKTLEYRGELGEKVKAFYDALRDKKEAKTSQITPFVYEEFFAPYLERGESILFLCLSNGLSSSYISAVTASENLKKKYTDAEFLPIDSINATGSMGIIIERMVKNKCNGLDLHQNKEDIDEFKLHLYTSTYVEDLMHLKRGGRIGAATAVIGSALGIKPIIRMTDGTLDQFNKVKGERKAVSELARAYKEMGIFDGEDSVYITDADNPKYADILEMELREINPAIIIKRSSLSPIIGTHLGPGAVVISFVRKLC